MAIREGADDFIKFMNELMELDPEWVRSIVNFRPECNEKIAHHPTVQVMLDEDGKFKAGFLGLMNGFFGSFDEGEAKGCGHIAIYSGSDEDKEAKEFVKFGPFIHKTELKDNGEEEKRA